MKKLVVGSLISISMLVGACGSDSENETITLSGTLSDGSAAVKLDLAAITISDLTLYCLTFESTPTSASTGFGADGSFSVQLPANTPFGCFVNDSTNKTVGTFVVTGTGGFDGSTGTDTLSLSSSVNVGALTIGSDGTISIPAAKISTAQTAASTTLNPDGLHGSTYSMTCVTTGIASVDEACTQFLGSATNVYMRILKIGTVRGIGVWASSTAFSDCGSIDMTTAERTGIETDEGATFSQISDGAFAAHANCPRRNTSLPSPEVDESHNIENYFMLSKLEPVGAGYLARQEDGGSYSPNGADTCSYKHYTSVFFTGDAASTMIGAFSTGDKKEGTGVCPVGESHSKFSVKFTKQ